MNRNRLLAHGISRVPGLKRIPIFKLLALAEVAILAKAHYGRLSAAERSRLFQLVKTSRGRSGNLTQSERDELAGLVNKMEPRMFAGTAANQLSPIPLPKRLTHGPKSARDQQQQRAA
jgi:hypothetical protein